jgi:hypothetical protein
MAVMETVATERSDRFAGRFWRRLLDMQSQLYGDSNTVNNAAVWSGLLAAYCDYPSKAEPFSAAPCATALWGLPKPLSPNSCWRNRNNGGRPMRWLRQGQADAGTERCGL